MKNRYVAETQSGRYVVIDANVGWFSAPVAVCADLVIADRIAALLNREERLKLYVGPTLRVRVDRVPA